MKKLGYLEMEMLSWKEAKEFIDSCIEENLKFVIGGTLDGSDNHLFPLYSVFSYYGEEPSFIDDDCMTDESYFGFDNLEKEFNSK